MHGICNNNNMITVDITTVIVTHINFFLGIRVEYDCVVVQAFVSPHFFTLTFTNIDTSIGLTMNDLPSITIDCIMLAVQKINFGTKIMTLMVLLQITAQVIVNILYQYHNFLKHI